MGNGEWGMGKTKFRRDGVFSIPYSLFPTPDMKKAPSGRFFHVQAVLVGAAGFEPTTSLFAINNLAKTCA